MTTTAHNCDHCGYQTNLPAHWKRHVVTEKHKNKILEFTLDLPSEIVNISMEEYLCMACDYKTYSKSDYRKHTKSKKHMSINDISNNTILVCNYCNNQYATASSLCKHKTKCKNNHQNDEKLKNVKTTNDISSLLTAENFLELMKKNNELQNLLVEQQIRHEENSGKMIEKVLDIVSTNSNATNNTTHTNSHNTNNFNLNLFLNETCKDALNFSEFMNSIKLNLEDLEKMAELGYVDGISRIFVNALKNTDTEHRPLHCTDVKRETVYIKERDKWDKDTTEKSTLKRAIEHIANKNIQNIQVWKEEHPNSLIGNTDDSNQLDQLYQVTVNNSEKDENKIIRKLLPEITIDK